MNNRELATEFVKKYPNMFTEDQGFWIEEIEKLLNKSRDILIDKIEKK
jgi:hypothetical protein